ncbi:MULTISPECIES: DUF349 domain-containing protein [Flavobacteriaceae]|uniref:DUF349 domain-containing protein n=2 Tax=Flavobacteriaceae TaxID=49546 RepID=A0A4Y8AZA2_9FLAO|nr:MULTISPECIES: DUF349 domain-containing protein [Flavobacteriaceae]TEW77118.1 DUF349 domain-containing protein [Gramella jeungdoensis]GGK57717.1 hypothetical protein GCM10007963_27400 [Lutibacter litoralis]
MLDQEEKLPVQESNSTDSKDQSKDSKTEINAETTAKIEDKLEVEIKEEAETTEVTTSKATVVDEAKPEISEETKAEITPETPVKPEIKEGSNSDKAIDEIDNKIAESSEKSEHQEIEMEDYESLSLDELVAELGKLVKEGQVQSINSNVNKIKSIFNLKFGKLLKAEKEKFLAEGGNIIDFQYNNPIKSTYNSFLYDFKIKRNEFYANQDAKLNSNLEEKLELIENLKHLIDNAEGATMYKMFKDIQTKWVAIGPIPRAKYNDTWRTYQHHVERFYDLLHLSNDLRDLDFKHNLEEKLKLIDRAEALLELEDVNTAFKELQVLHKLWKEDIGPVARENREEVWERFSEVTKKIHDNRHEFFKDMKSKFEGNIDKKLEVITAIEAIAISKNNSRADWQKSIKELEVLRNKFFSIGQVPRAKSDQIWSKFKDATRKFNVEKNKFFKNIKKEHLENLNLKKALIEKAVALKDSEDWDTTTEVMKRIQSDWKKIGHVPRKYSDKLWKEFKDACNHYFDRLHKNQDIGNKEQIEVLNKKKDLLSTIKEAIGDSSEISIDTLNGYVSDWRELGRVPYEMRHIEVKFNKLLDKVVDNSDAIEKQDIEMIKFKNLVNSYLEQKNYRKLDSEQLFIRKKIDETIREIQQLENNIGFISNVSEDNPLVQNVRKQIDVYKEKLEIWKDKLNYLKELES